MFVDMFLFSYILIWLESARGRKSEGFFADVSNNLKQMFRCVCCACCFSARTGNLDKDEEDRLSNELEDDDVKRERRQCEIEYGTDNFEEQKEEEEKSSLLEKGKMKNSHSIVFKSVCSVVRVCCSSVLFEWEVREFNPITFSC